MLSLFFDSSPLSFQKVKEQGPEKASHLAAERA
jgi:hypothetical protein